MFRYIVYRLVQLIPVMLLVSFIVFAFMHMLPGDVIDALAGEAESHDPAVRAALTKELGLDKPLYVQYVIWLGKIVLHGDFGKSITTRRTIGVEVFKRLPATMYLAVAAVVISLIIAVPLGTLAAIKRRTMTDYVVTTGAVLGLSIPQFWFAILCVLVFALYLGWLPASEYYSPFSDPWRGLQTPLAASVGARGAPGGEHNAPHPGLDAGRSPPGIRRYRPFPRAAGMEGDLQIHPAQRLDSDGHHCWLAVCRSAGGHGGDRGHLFLAGHWPHPVGCHQ